jgi:capsid assembly protease
MNRRTVLSYLTARKWAMDPDHLRAVALQAEAGLQVLSPEAVSAAQQVAEERLTQAGYSVRDGVAHICVAGVILKEVPCIFDLLGISATSTVAVQAALSSALQDTSVTAISLDIDSPGGSIAGVQELADAVYAARGVKRVVAHASDLIASAAYWIGSQAEELTANEGCLVGSVGVYAVMEDTSAADAMAGIKVHVIRSHELKGAGAGDEITPAQILDEQRIIDAAAEMFISAVARGRGMSVDHARAVATGQVWFANDAKGKALVDEVVSALAAHERVATRAQQRPTKQITAPSLGAKESKVMEADELKTKLAEAEAQANELAAENNSLRGSIKALEANQRAALVEKYRSRIAPANLEAVLAYGEFCGADLKKFEAHLLSLPVVTRADRVSTAPNDDPNDVPLSDDDREMCELFGLREDTVKKFQGAKYVEAHTGRVVFEDGSVREVN